MEIINLNKAVNDRFKTLINNIKNASNSYYDSFLDLLEETIKYILNENNIVYDATKTCGAILKEKDVSCFLLETLALDEYTFSKLPDYIKKCNDHKHKKEKTLSLESVTNYLKVYFRLINYYFSYKEIDEIEYDENYFINIFNETEKLNNQYKEEVNKLKNELEDAYNKKQLTEDAYLECKSLLTNSEIEKYSLEEQNKFLEIQIKSLNNMKESINLSLRLAKLEKQNDFIIENLQLNNTRLQQEKSEKQQENEKKFKMFLFKAKKEFISSLSKNAIEESKQNIKYACIVTFVLGIVLTILNTIHYGYYTTYSLFENIWMIFTAIIFFKNFKMDKIMLDEDLYNVTSFKKESNIYSFANLTSEKSSYKVLRVLAYISAGASMFLALIDNFSPLILILELIFIISVYHVAKHKNYIQNGYKDFIKFTGKNLDNNEMVSIVFSMREKRFYSYEEFIIKFKGKMN